MVCQRLYVNIIGPFLKKKEEEEEAKKETKQKPFRNFCIFLQILFIFRERGR